MNILIAPDSFKGSLTALKVCKSIKKGILNYAKDYNVDYLPVADGGEGTVRSLVDATEGKLIYEKVTGPLGKEIKSFYGILGDRKTAVIEMAQASGLPLVPEDKRDPSKTTTYGTGELIKSAVEHDVDTLIIGIGGSSTNDAGVGMAQALGIEFLDIEGKQIGFGGGDLDKIKKINTENLNSKVKNTKILVACDVDNPLYGKDGAAYVYGAQKGANPRMIKELDNNLRYFNRLLKKEINKDVNQIKGAGAAGGLGAGLAAFLDAKLKPGIEIILDYLEFDKKVKNVDIVITGEGMLDGQSVFGKTPIGVARRAKKYNIPVIALVGSIGDQAEKVLNYGIDSYFSIVDKPDELNSISERTPLLLSNTIEQIIRTININNLK